MKRPPKEDALAKLFSVAKDETHIYKLKSKKKKTKEKIKKIKKPTHDKLKQQKSKANIGKLSSENNHIDSVHHAKVQNFTPGAKIQRATQNIPITTQIPKAQTNVQGQPFNRDSLPGRPILTLK